MERSLSVLLPVRNAQATLAATVQEILEVLPELTSRFELIVVDDGSTDATLEVADDLAAHYPQVLAVRHATPRGHSASIRTGLQRSSGDIIFLRDPNSQLALDEVYKLWWAIEEHPLVLGRSSERQRSGRWIGWKRRGGQETLRMVDLRAARAVQKSLDQQTQFIASLADQGDQWFEVELRGRSLHRAEGPIGSRALGRAKKAVGPTGQGALDTSAAAEKVARPKYLRSLKDFALGE